MEVYEQFQSISVDFQTVSVEPDDYGFSCLCNFVCDTIKFCELVPARDKSAKEAARCYIQVFGRYGAPEYIHSDKGTSFSNEIITSITILLCSKLSYSIAYRHQSNAHVIRLNSEVRRHLSVLLHVNYKKAKWSLYVLSLQRIINATTDV